MTLTDHTRRLHNLRSAIANRRHPLPMTAAEQQELYEAMLELACALASEHREPNALTELQLAGLLWGGPAPRVRRWIDRETGEPCQEVVA